MPKPEQIWLEGAVAALQPPKDLRERNWLQVVLAERYHRQFRVSKFEAIQAISPVFAQRFPH